MVKSPRSELMIRSDDTSEHGCREEDPASRTGEALRLIRSANILILVEQDPFEPNLQKRSQYGGDGLGWNLVVKCNIRAQRTAKPLTPKSQARRDFDVVTKFEVPNKFYSRTECFHSKRFKKLYSSQPVC